MLARWHCSLNLNCSLSFFVYSFFCIIYGTLEMALLSYYLLLFFSLYTKYIFYTYPDILIIECEILKSIYTTTDLYYITHKFLKFIIINIIIKIVNKRIYKSLNK